MNSVPIRRAMQVCVVSFGLLFASITMPQESPASEELSTEKAEKVARDALLLYKVGKVEEAIEKWQEAYSLLKNPGILLNLASCYWENGDLLQAKKMFVTFLRETPKEYPNRPFVERKLKSLEVSIADSFRHLKGLEINTAIPSSFEIEEGPKTQKRRNRIIFWSAVTLGAILAGSTALSIALSPQPESQGTDLGTFPAIP